MEMDYDDDLDLLSSDNPSNCKIPLFISLKLSTLENECTPIGRDEYDMISRRILQFAPRPPTMGVCSCSLCLPVLI
ncbi:ATV_HP_G0008380.mRNA.1.CDS.1 [Saccharomyces cerevisiae]|nr:ATV_HP_G0008380.mRNA.1.CDS.1 [Saccharomyces cerevisiae]CAI6941647.1 ATV_HP_G0008380.mRNA.1.CDS.1 [Saccharomyces cerevisiae]